MIFWGGDHMNVCIYIHVCLKNKQSEKTQEWVPPELEIVSGLIKGRIFSHNKYNLWDSLPQVVIRAAGFKEVRKIHECGGHDSKKNHYSEAVCL